MDKLPREHRAHKHTEPQAGADLANIMNDPEQTAQPVIRRVLSKVEQAIQSIRRSDGSSLTGSIGFMVVRPQDPTQALAQSLLRHHEKTITS